MENREMMQTSSGGLDCELVASSIAISIQENDLTALCEILTGRSNEDIQRIVNYKINGNAALYLACQTGNQDIVTFLLDECWVDMNMKGIYEEKGRELYVPPIWCAATNGELGIVKALVQHGADVILPSNTNSTPVRASCYSIQVDVIKYLVENGADIHKPNSTAGTCLMLGVQSDELCEYLIKEGADINAVDKWNNTALEWAVRGGTTGAVKLLLNHGVNFKLRNNAGHDALTTAALYRNREAIDVILDFAHIDVEERIRAYELLGTSYITDKDDTESAVLVWKEAMTLRHQNENAVVPKRVSSERKRVFQFAKETETLEEIDGLTDPHRIYIEAMLIREWILGQFHEDTTYILMYRGAVYADAGEYQKCVDLWTHAYKLRYHCSDTNCVSSAKSIVSLLLEFQQKIEKSETAARISTIDTLDVLETLTEQILSVQQSHPKDLTDTVIEQRTDIRILGQLFPHLINLIECTVATTVEREIYIDLIIKVVGADPRCDNNLSLLHLAVDPSTSVVDGEFYSDFPSPRVVITLIKCGADVFAQSSDGRLPIHHAELHLIAEATPKLKLVSLILLLFYNILKLKH